ncbi:MAG TPA: Dabb family protein [Aquella sp.]|nr:Dabb family protein [Aquella sp.]
MEIKHIVVFKYKPTVTLQQKQEVMNRFLALKEECKKDGKSYIISLIGGDCTKSQERLTSGFEHSFIATFKNQDDFNYYLGDAFTSPFDLVHDEFKKFVGPFLAVDENGKTNGAMVFDFLTSY